MDYGTLLADAAEFTRASMAEDLRRGLALVVLFALATSIVWALPLILPLEAPLRIVAVLVLVVVSLVAGLILCGYFDRIFRHPREPPPLADPAGLALAGVRLLVVFLAYLLPSLAVLLILGGIGVTGIVEAIQSQDLAAMYSAVATLGLGFLLALIIGAGVGFLGSIAIVRSTRRGGIREAFHLSAILEHIGRIGWVNYIVALVVLWIVLGLALVAIGIFSGLPLIGWVAGIVIGPAALIFSARYLSLVYDSAPEP